MAKSLELAAFAAFFFAIIVMASRLHYAAGYAASDMTIWAVACIIGTIGFIGCGMAAIFAFGESR